MLVRFRSKAAAEVVMYEDHAKRILDLLNKDVKMGVITPAEAGQAIEKIEQEIAESKRNPSPEEAESETQRRDDDDSDQQKIQHVPFATRAYPLLEMLRAADKSGSDVLWGVV